MATVTGFTAERMQQIEDESVVDGSIVGTHLNLVQRDGTVIDAGVVVGPQGVAGPQGPAGANASFDGYTENITDLGNVAGVVTLDFALHNVWKITPTGAVTIAFANLPAAGKVTSGTLIVANSSFAISWPAGTQFPGGAAPALSGKSLISMFANSTQMMVAAAWTGVA